MSRQVIITMKAFEREIHSGCTQAELLYRLKELPGVDGFEIRRELMNDHQQESLSVKKANEDYKARIIYSAPESLFKDGEPDLKSLVACVDEAAKMGADTLKLSTGALDYGNPGKIVQVMQVVMSILSLSKLKLTFENDQTKCSGSIRSMKNMMELCGNSNLSVGCTFDMGNWLYVHEDPLAAAQQLAPYVSYVHIKDVQQTETGLMTVSPGKGFLDWRELLRILPKQCPIGLEFQIESMDETKILVQELKK